MPPLYPGLALITALSAATFSVAQTDVEAGQSHPPAPADGSWSQWRGPDRSGHCPEPIWPEGLNGDSLAKQWRVGAGPSYSGPVVDDERVYTTATVDESHEIVIAFDRRSGEEIWTTEWEGAVKVPFFAAKNGSWIRSTPALSDGMLFVAGMCDVLVCLAADTGKEIWRVDFTERFATKREDFGFVCSPLVRGDFVYAHSGAGMVKLNKRSGETVWRSLHEGPRSMMNSGAFSSPVFATVAGREQLLVQGRAALHGVDDENGEVLWSMPVKTFRGMNILTPMPYGDGIFTSAYGGRAHYFTVSEKDGAFTVEQKWTNRAQGYMTSPVVIDGHAYLYLRSKRFCCVDLEAGEVRWITGPIGDEYWSLVAQGQRILALSDAGELNLIAANPKRYELLDTVEVSAGQTWAHLAVDGGQVCVRELDGLTTFAWK